MNNIYEDCEVRIFLNRDWFICRDLMWTHSDLYHRENEQGHLQRSDSPSVRREIFLPCNIIHTQNFLGWSELQDGFSTAEPSLCNMMMKFSYTPWATPSVSTLSCTTVWLECPCALHSQWCAQPFHRPTGTFRPCPALRELVFAAAKEAQALPVLTAALFPRRSGQITPRRDALNRGTEHVLPNMFYCTLGL